MRYLTKSRFKLGVECPTKLYYTGKPEYVNTSLDNSFLAALAEGGHQVGALACLMYPDGVAVEGRNHAQAVERTRELLERDEVTIYEAAFLAGDYFVRVDVLRKRGHRVELIEVKAKSYDPAEDGDMCDRNGRIRSSFRPYLDDVAYQTYVARLARPDLVISPFLMLADKSTRATVAGLNQRFMLRRSNGGVRVEVAPGTHRDLLGEPLLRAIAVDAQVESILTGTIAVGHDGLRPFADAVARMATAYREEVRIAPKPGAGCGSCEFKAKALPADGESRSGFHECWTEAFAFDQAAFERGTVLDLWNSKKKKGLIEAGSVRLSQVTPEDLGFDGDEPGTEGLSVAQRQWFQVSGEWPGGGDYYFAAHVFRNAHNTWRYPLHFIDFETSAVAIPFFEGCAPYETTAFQFSHHVMHADGRVEHRTQFLQAEPGLSPNVDFVRALREALRHDEGTIFRWADHENTVLNQIRRQLLGMASPPADLHELVAFTESITSRGDGALVGERSMVDLCLLAQRAFFHPATKGSSSLKQVLPALMASSAHLRRVYGEPAIYGGPGMPSLNFGSSEPKAWWVRGEDGAVMDPYKLLPALVDGFSCEVLEALKGSDSPLLKDGGAAMAAYAQLQMGEMSADHRRATEAALLRYCELDTLAMVMAVQAWEHWANDAAR